MKEFTWNEETIDYFAELYDSNGWAHVSQGALAFVKVLHKLRWLRLLDDCEVQDDETYQDLFGDLINKIEDKVNKEEYEWLEAKLQEKELD